MLQDLSFEPEIRRLVAEAGARLGELRGTERDESLPAWDKYRRAVDAAHSYVDQAILDAGHGITDHRNEAA